MRILIIEDEAPAVRRLISMIKDLDPKNEILEVLTSVSGSVQWLLTNKHPDLIFLDIHLSDGNSFRIFEKCEVSCPIIFATAYDEYALKAFKVNSIDYLLKPIEASDLRIAIEKYKNRTVSQSQINVQELLKSLQKNTKDYKQRFIVRISDRLIPVDVADIQYFITDEKVVLLHTLSSNFIVDFTLDELQEMLDPKLFFRFNRKVLGQARSITKIFNHINGRLKILIQPSANEDIYISREKVREFKTWLEN